MWLRLSLRAPGRSWLACSLSKNLHSVLASTGAGRVSFLGPSVFYLGFTVRSCRILHVVSDFCRLIAAPAIQTPSCDWHSRWHELRSLVSTGFSLAPDARLLPECRVFHCSWHLDVVCRAVSVLQFGIVVDSGILCLCSTSAL
jgi:hypothetical protein